MALRRERRKPTDPRALVGSAIRLPSKGAGVKKAGRKPEEWQHECWDFYDTVPELKFAGIWVGNQLSKVRLYVAVADDEHNAIPIDSVDVDGKPHPATVDFPDALKASAVAELARLRSDLGGQPELQREMAVNLDFAGDCYLVGWAKRAAKIAALPGEVDQPEVPEQWEIRSLDEVENKGQKWVIHDEPGDAGRDLTEDDTIIRCYQRHPRWSKLADSNVRGTISECRLLQALTGQMYAETLSRHNAGAITLPDGLTFGKATPTGPTPQSGDEQKETPFVDDMTNALTRPIDDPTDPLSVVPWLIQGRPELLHPDVLRKIDFGRGGTEDIDKKITARVTRLAHGINLPVEVLLGHMQTTFANAAQINEDTFTDFVESRVLLQCDILSEWFLRANLRDSNYDADLVRRIFVWYDASALMDDPDPSEAADEALGNFAINLPGYRKLKGIPDEMAPTFEEQMGLVAMTRGILTAELTGALLQVAFPKLVLPDLQAGQGNAAPADDDELSQVSRILRATGLPVSVLAALAFQLTQQTPPIALAAAAEGGADPPSPAPA